jgi:major membrane immunogen (membrane-anchored lipoprotein)
MMARPQLRLGRIGLSALIGLGSLWLVGCSGPTVDHSLPLHDGAYTGRSEPDEEGAYGEVRIKVAGGAIVETAFDIFWADGSLKDEDYGKDSDGAIGNPAAYEKAQEAVAAFDVYARELLAEGFPDEVDVISGATLAHRQFVEAAVAAVKESQDNTP